MSAETAIGPPPFPAAYRRLGWVSLYITGPVFAGTSGALSLALPLLAPLLLPLSVTRLLRRALQDPNDLWAGFWPPVLALPAAFVAGLLLLPGGGFLAPVTVAVFVSLPTLAVFVSGRDGRPLADVTIVTAAICGSQMLAILAGVQIASGEEAGGYLARRLLEYGGEVGTLYRQAGLSETMITATQDVFVFMSRALEKVAPGIGLLIAVLYAAFVVYSAAPFGNGATKGVTGGSFSGFRTGAGPVFAFVLTGLAAGLGSGSVRSAGSWLVLPLLALFFLQGLAIIRFLLDRLGAGAFARILAFALALQMPMPLIIAGAGLLDEFFDFRQKLARPENPDMP